MLEVRDLHSAYHLAEVIQGVSLDVREGEMVALIGANGAGKSTLLNTISGFIPKAYGSIQFSGSPILGQPSHSISRQGLLQVPEGRQVVQTLTTLDNLLLGEAALGNRPQKFTLQAVFELFPILAERSGQMAGTLSGGQQQMLAIGRALMGSPRLLLLDEPSLGLAPLIVTQVFQTLRRLNGQGMTILLVEQNARLALRVSDRAYVLERGRVVFTGPSAQLASDPRVIDLYLGHGHSEQRAA